jgi:hypothetical protein
VELGVEDGELDPVGGEDVGVGVLDPVDEAGLPRRNGWTIAQHAGDRSPDRTQRLLNRASWDTFAAMSEVRRFAVAGLEEAARRDRRRGGLVIGAVDETGQEKAGEATAGLKRQYMGCAGRVANGINTVHLSYGHHPTRPPLPPPCPDPLRDLPAPHARHHPRHGGHATPKGKPGTGTGAHEAPSDRAERAAVLGEHVQG